MKTYTLTITLGSDPILAEATLKGGQISYNTTSERLERILRDLLDQDFARAVGFPGVFTRAKQNTPEALFAAADYFKSYLGFSAVVRED